MADFVSSTYTLRTKALYSGTCRAFKRERILIFSSIYLNTAAAYNIYFFPVVWLSTIIALGAVFSFSTRRGGILPFPRELRLILVLIIVSVFSTAFHLFLEGELTMPTQSTLPYGLFLTARYFNMVGFVACSIAVYTYCLYCGTAQLIKLIQVAVFLVSIVALYIYIAQVYGLWELPRTRIGTGGQDFTTEAVSFQYLFHRALGTFREPSHLAQWLTGPVLMMLAISHRKSTAGSFITIVISILVLILTGSFLGALGFATGFLFIVAMNIRRLSFKYMIIIAVIPFSLIAAKLIFGVDFLAAVLPRMADMAFGGIEATNRDFVWRYLTESPPPIFGYGIGNSNIRLSEYLGSPLMSSHSGLFTQTLYSLGAPGFVVIVVFLLGPFWIVLKNSRFRSDTVLLGCLAAHLAWIIFYSGDSEELSAIHSALLGLLWARVRKLRFKKYVNQNSV